MIQGIKLCEEIDNVRFSNILKMYDYYNDRIFQIIKGDICANAYIEWFFNRVKREESWSEY